VLDAHSVPAVAKELREVPVVRARACPSRFCSAP